MEMYQEVLQAGEYVEDRMAEAYINAYSNGSKTKEEGVRVAKAHINKMRIRTVAGWYELLRKHDTTGISYSRDLCYFYVTWTE